MTKSSETLSSTIIFSVLFIGVFSVSVYAISEREIYIDSNLNFAQSVEKYEIDKENKGEIDNNRGSVEENDDDSDNALATSSLLLDDDGDKRNLGGRIFNRLLIMLGFRNEEGEALTEEELANIASVLQVSKVSDSSAEIKWSGNKLSKVAVFYSTSSPIVVATETNTNFVESKALRRKVKLKKLEENTTYYYRIVVTDHLGNSTTSKELSFTTKR